MPCLTNAKQIKKNLLMRRRVHTSQTGLLYFNMPVNEFTGMGEVARVNVGRFAYRMIRLQVDSPTLETIRLHVLRCFLNTEVDSPTTQYRRKVYY